MALQIQGTLVCPARGRMAPPGGIKLVVMRGDAVDPGQKSAGPDRWTPKHVIATHLPEQSGGIGRHSNAACAEFPYSCVGVLTAGAFTAQNVSSQSKCRRSWGELSLQWGPAMDDMRPIPAGRILRSFSPKQSFAKVGFTTMTDV
jgi:hypothetical protein